jgi:hypothetical protein
VEEKDLKKKYSEVQKYRAVAGRDWEAGWRL